MDDYGDDMNDIMRNMPIETDNALCRFLFDSLPHDVVSESFLRSIGAV